MTTTLASDAQVLSEIERFCKAHNMGITTFGRAAIGDPNLVANMRKGRSLTLKTANAVAAYMARAKNEAAVESSQAAAA